MLFTVEVLETQTVLRGYVVEANSKEEALDKAGSGETVFEKTLKTIEVRSRAPKEETLTEVPAESEE